MKFKKDLIEFKLLNANLVNLTQEDLDTIKNTGSFITKKPIKDKKAIAGVFLFNLPLFASLDDIDSNMKKYMKYFTQDANLSYACHQDNFDNIEVNTLFVYN